MPNENHTGEPYGFGPLETELTPRQKWLCCRFRDEGVARGLQKAFRVVALAKATVNAVELPYLVPESAVRTLLFNRLCELEAELLAELERTPRGPFRQR